MYIQSTNYNRILQNNIKNLSQITHKLSTGNRINQPSDDGAGLQISTRLTSQIKGASQAIRNIKDGISLLSTAEGNLETVQNMLQRMRELTIQGKNGTYSAEQKISIEAEMNELINGINGITKNSSFNGIPLLSSGSSVNLSGSSVDHQRVKIENIPVNTTPGAKTTVEFWMKWDGTNRVMPFGWDSRYDIWLRNGNIGINTGANSLLGTSSDALINDWNHIAVTFVNGVPDENNVDLYINGDKQVLTDLLTGIQIPQSVTSTIHIGGWGQSDLYDFGGSIDELKIWDGARTEEQVKNDMYSTASNNDKGLLGYWKIDDEKLNDDSSNGNNGQLVNGASLSDGITKSLSIHTGSESNSTDKISLFSFSDETLDLKNISLDDPDLIKKIDNAINAISVQRGELGSKINRYEFKLGDLQNNINNTEAARMRIRDLDMSSAMSELTKTDIQMKTTQQMLKVDNSMYEQKMQMLFN